MINLVFSNRSLIMASVFFITLNFSYVAKAEIYRWIDENGKTHISDRAPEDSVENVQTLENQDIKINAVGENESSKRGREKYLNSLSESQKKAEADKAKKQELEAKNNAVCKKIKVALNKLNGGTVLFNTNEKGERTYMDDNEREKNNAELSASYNKNCRSYQKSLE